VRPFPRKAFLSRATLVPRPKASGLLELTQRSPLAGGLAAEALLGNAPGPFALGAIKGVKAAANCLAVDAELVDQFDHTLTPRDPADEFASPPRPSVWPSLAHSHSTFVAHFTGHIDM
jgi:hypothetical protein